MMVVFVTKSTNVAESSGGRCTHSYVDGIKRIQYEDYLNCSAQGTKHREGRHPEVRVLKRKNVTILSEHRRLAAAQVA